MPRRSAEARATLTALSANRLQPSTHLNADEAAAWRSVVGATPAAHLSERDRPLLDAYAVLTVEMRRLHADLHAEGADRENVTRRIEGAARTLSGLANRLKLGPLAATPDAHKARSRNEKPAVKSHLLGGSAVVRQ